MDKNKSLWVNYDFNSQVPLDSVNYVDEDEVKSIVKSEKCTGGETTTAEISLVAGDNITITSAETGNTIVAYTISSTVSGSGTDLPIYKGVDESGHTVSGAVVVGNSTNKSIGLYSLSEGGFGKDIVGEGGSDVFISRGTSALGLSSHAEGVGTLALGCNSHAEGEATVAQYDMSHAEGEYTSAISFGAHSEGGYTLASSTYAHAEGQGTSAIGNDAHSEGGDTYAYGEDAHAEGGSTSAIGRSAHSEGFNTLASGDGSHAEGESTSAMGESSHAEGWTTIANGKASFTHGYYTMTSNDYEASFGVANLSTQSSTLSSSTLFSVGRGDIDTRTLANALEIKRNGDVYLNAYVHPKDFPTKAHYNVDFNKVIQALIDAGTLVL